MKTKLPALVHRSTLSFFREGFRAHGYSLFDALHGYVYGRWPYLYIGIGVGEHPFSRRVWPRIVKAANWFRDVGQPGRRRLASRRQSTSLKDLTGHGRAAATPTGIAFANGYHGKVVPLAAARQLVTVNEPVRLTDLEKIIPYTRARDIILQNPDHIVALECPCRSARPHPCLPLDVCLIVGEPFASFVSDHHPRKSRWISSREAVDILTAEQARGHVSHAIFKDAMLGRFYAICNCCSCCCGAMQAQRSGTPMLASSGYTARVDEDLCIGCGTCEQTCQFAAIHLDGYVSRVDEQACMGCGVCVSHCEQEALSLERDSHGGEPLEIFVLMQAAAANLPAGMASP